MLLIAGCAAERPLNLVLVMAALLPKLFGWSLLIQILFYKQKPTEMGWMQ